MSRELNHKVNLALAAGVMLGFALHLDFIAGLCMGFLFLSCTWTVYLDYKALPKKPRY